MSSKENLIRLNGIDFIEYSSPDPESLSHLWQSMGFVYKGRHKSKNVELYSQGYSYFVLNKEKDTFAEDFSKKHGPSVCALAFRVKSKKKAFELACAKGAEAVPEDKKSHDFPAIYGVGRSVIYFVEDGVSHFDDEFSFSNSKEKIKLNHYGLLSVDHLTHNVPSGDMQKWCDFYQEVFGFTERRYFDIQGAKTGLISKVIRSPCNTITIPINEPAEGEKGKKSQIQEFLEEYNGSGIQHIALTTKDIVSSVQNLRSSGIDFLDVPDTYYDNLSNRVPHIKEDLKTLQENKILADGDEKGYLLQIFTKNVVGPIFYEVIKRYNHNGFGEGNFQALFDAMERDQIHRGVFNS